jgi:hypothetical protein
VERKMARFDVEDRNWIGEGQYRRRKECGEFLRTLKGLSKKVQREDGKVVRGQKPPES